MRHRIATLVFAALIGLASPAKPFSSVGPAEAMAMMQTLATMIHMWNAMFGGGMDSAPWDAWTGAMPMSGMSAIPGLSMGSAAMGSGMGALSGFGGWPMTGTQAMPWSGNWAGFANPAVPWQSLQPGFPPQSQWNVPRPGGRPPYGGPTPSAFGRLNGTWRNESGYTMFITGNRYVLVAPDEQSTGGHLRIDPHHLMVSDTLSGQTRQYTWQIENGVLALGDEAGQVQYFVKLSHDVPR